MSDEHRDLYYNFPFNYNQYGSFESRGMHTPYTSPSSTDGSPQLGFAQHSPYMSFTECLHGGSTDYNSLSRAFGFSPSSPEVVSSLEGGANNPILPVEVGETGVVQGSENPATPNSSISSSSTEAGGEEDSSKGRKESQVKEVEDGGESSKKGNKSKKKGEKRQREPRFAFMTKSEVDHLEDGYRWRKYGQKAVKNSPYPRSYYRCTTQKCTVKKRVERSFQDPTIVITTYEGQHNHPIPATLRGNAAAAGMFSHSMFAQSTMATPSFPSDLWYHQNVHRIGNNQGVGASNATGGSMNQQNNIITSTSPSSAQPYQFSHDYGLLQDMLPPYFKQEPPY